MKKHRNRLVVSVLSVTVVLGMLVGCGGGDKALSNGDPGINDVNAIDAFGDSLTQGGQCSCAPYPGRVSLLVGKIVYNSGQGGSRIASGVGRVQSTINQYHPGFMFVLYGMNDVIHGGNMANTLGGLNQIVAICKQNQVVPVLATYPVPIKGHSLFAWGTIQLNEGIRAIADAEGIKCVDLEHEFAAPSDPAFPDLITSDPSLLVADGLHPNDTGTQIMAMAFADLF